MTSARKSKNRQIYSWALYDFGNSAFVTTVVAGFFPIFFKKYWSQGVDTQLTTANLGYANSLASLVIALTAPFLGAIADAGGTRKKFLGGFAFLGIVMTFGLYFVEAGQWPLAAALYVFASLGYFGANIFYDSLMVVVADNDKMDFVSALGFSLGYLGGSILFTVNAIMVAKPELFGIPDSTIAVKIAILSVAVWWLIFSLPILLWVPEEKPENSPAFFKTIVSGYQQVISTFKKVREMKVLGLFLLAYIFYIDGVNTMIKMAVSYGLDLGFDANNLMTALIILNWVAFPCAIAFGFLGEKYGARKGIYLAICIYIAVTIWGYFMTNVIEFYCLAAAIGMVQGGIQSLSRSYYAQMIPVKQSSEFFGFFNMVGKFSAIFGPALMGYAAAVTGDARKSILVIVLLFVLGGALLLVHSKFRSKEA